MISRWIGWGLTLGCVGVGLCGGVRDGGFIPINKNLWSPSFVACVVGTGYLCLALAYFLCDFWRVWSGNPFRVVGMNSIVVGTGSREQGARE